MFGPLTASGLYVRHATVVVLSDVRFETLAPDTRPPIVTDDAEVLER